MGNPQHSSNSQIVPTKSVLSAAISNLKDSETSQGLKAIATQYNDLMNIQLPVATVKDLAVCHTINKSPLARLAKQLIQNDKTFKQVVGINKSIANIRTTQYKATTTFWENNSLQQISNTYREITKALLPLTQYASPLVSYHKNTLTSIKIAQQYFMMISQSYWTTKQGISSAVQLASLKNSIPHMITSLTLPESINYGEKHQSLEQQSVCSAQNQLHSTQKKRLPQRQLDSLIEAVYNKKNTFKDFKQIIPDLNSQTMMDYLENPSSIKSENPSDSYYSTSTYSSINQCYFRLMSGSNDFSEGYDFKETDKFSLSIAGEDRKYELERENFILEITTGRNKSITCSRLPSCQQYILLPTSCIPYITDERIISNSKPHQEYFPCTNLVHSYTAHQKGFDLTAYVLNHLKQTVFSSQYLQMELDTMLTEAITNPTDAIGKAKELIESCCKTILDEMGIPFNNKVKFPQLCNIVLSKLKLTPKSIPNDSPANLELKSFCGNLRGVISSIAEIRNLYGNGHGKEITFKCLEMPQAILIANSAVNLCFFLWLSWQETKKQQETITS
ncbi:abortive infection family protein [Acidaminococcus sp. NSJ-142]|jgi:hypothetical protein|uniref:abortive infection family protein n=1 Tax=Acidaminococcus TaxID=904 RepID=UPI001E32E2DD|nr:MULTISPECIES: abortive infection family protein [Acidaminococcus]MCD2436459.1 abortive infection family protein [Acidaminococcus hominis]MCH4095041.1 abortive infection family protein [Acidaminococcus provencensis]